MIEVEFNDEAVTRTLRAAADELGDLTPLMQSLGEFLVASTQDRIARGEQPDGAPFAPRSPTTTAIYDKLGLSYGLPLNRSGDMRLGISYSPGPDSVTVGSNAIQSAVMQFGAPRGTLGASGTSPWGDIPARPFLGISEDDRAGILAEVAEWLDGLAGD